MTNELQQASSTWRVTPDMMCILDRQGCFVAVNPAWEPTLGWTRDEMLGQPYIDFLHPDDVEPSIQAFEVVKTGKPVLRFENRYRHRNGDYRWFSWVAVPEGGRFYCTVRDVTEDKDRIELIKQKDAEAELRELFLAVLGHDLRNPLAAIEAGTRLIERKADDGKVLQIARQMQGSAARMTELIDNLMDLARDRLGSGIAIEREATSSLPDNLALVIDEIRLTTDEFDIRSKINIQGEVVCDASRVAQLLSNLLANAITHGDPASPVDVQAAHADGRLTISVTNGGAPIPEATMKQLFQPFFRGSVRDSRHGLGLGLYIAHQIATAHEGTLDVTSANGETCFRLDIPA